jgi:DNA-binding response OmpR family regulator
MQYSIGHILMLTLCHSVSESVLGVRAQDFFYYDFRIPGLVFFMSFKKLRQNSVGLIHMLTLCHSVSERVLVLGLRAHDFIFYEFTF